MSNYFEAVPHTADLQILVHADTIENLFRISLRGMFESIKPISDFCEYKDEKMICKDLPIKRTIKVASANQEFLLVDFLSEAWSFSDIYNEAYFDAKIFKLTQNLIEAEIIGVPIKGYEVVEIKAVTYHDLYVKKVTDPAGNEAYEANIVFDI